MVENTHSEPTPRMSLKDFFIKSRRLFSGSLVAGSDHYVARITDVEVGPPSEEITFSATLLTNASKFGVRKEIYGDGGTHHSFAVRYDDGDVDQVVINDEGHFELSYFEQQHQFPFSGNYKLVQHLGFISKKVADAVRSLIDEGILSGDIFTASQAQDALALRQSIVFAAEDGDINEREEMAILKQVEVMRHARGISR